MNQNKLKNTEDYTKLTKAARLKELKRRIDEALALGSNDLNLSGLGINEKDLEEINFKTLFQDSILESLDLSHNNFKNLQNLPNVSYFLDVDNNPKLNKIILNAAVEYLSFNNTSIDSLEDFKDFIKDGFEFENTPLERKLVPHREVDKSRVVKEMSSYKIPYETYTIPKGTVLFRNFHGLQDIASIYVGFKEKPELIWNSEEMKFGKSNTKGVKESINYTLHPDQNVFFFTAPQALNSFGKFGNIKTIFVLQNDITLLLGFKPSIRTKETSVGWPFTQENLFYETCKAHKIKKADRYKYGCLKSEYKEKNILGWFSNINIKVSQLASFSKAENTLYTPEYETFNKQFFIPEIAIYPKAKRETKDIITPISEFNEEWLHNHLSEFNYKPLYIFDEDVTPEVYKETFLQLLSPEGLVDSNDPSLVQQFTINKTDGTYVLAELASAETLINCLNVTEDKISYLTEYLKNN